MKTIKCATAILLAAILLIPSLGLAETAEQPWRLGDFTAVSVTGEPVDQSILKEARLTMLNVWATYCPPCIDEMPDLGRLAAAYKDQGVQIIGIVSDAMAIVDNTIVESPQMTAKALQLIEETQANYLHLLPSMDLYTNLLWQVEAVPLTLFLDSEGRQVGYGYAGSRPYESWADALDEALAMLP